MEEGSLSKVAKYSPFKTCIHFDNEDPLREKLKYIGAQDDILITTLEVEEGMPKEPPMPLLSLTVEDFKGKDIDLVIE